MALTLRVTSFHSQALGALGTKTFGAAGGTIGRNQGNDWVLPDPERFISGNHAQIVCRNGTYYLRDVSTNGTFVNGSPQPVGNGMEQPLQEGDRIQIGEYEIAVSIDHTDFNSITGPTGFNLGGGGTFSTGSSGPRVNTGRTAPPVGGSLLQDVGQPASADPLDFFADNAPVAPRLPNDPGVLPDHASPLDHFYQPPAVEHIPPPPAAPFPPLGDTPSAGIPEDWDMTGYASAPRRGPMHPQAPPPQPHYQPPVAPHAHAPAPPPAISAPPAQYPPSADQVGAVAALLMAAGLDAASARAAAANPGLHSTLGTVLNVVVQGMLDVLKARTDVKSQFRVPVTTMRPVENNPLKFSANATQALQNLLTAHNQAYLGPVEAFAEGFRDIKAHQIAMMAGMRAAFDSMLQRFDPQELAERFDKRLKRAALINLPGKGRYWELYRELYEEWTQDADLNFQRLFGEKFAQAYEEQMRRLTSTRR